MTDVGRRNSLFDLHFPGNCTEMKEIAQSNRTVGVERGGGKVSGASWICQYSDGSRISNRRWGCQPIILPNFPQKLHKNEKKNGSKILLGSANAMGYYP